MIVKIKTRQTPSYKQLLNYVTHNKDRLFDDQGKSFLITHNLKGENLEDWVSEFKENEKYRVHKRSDSVMLTHEIVSFHKDDEISLEMLEDMAHKYIELRNPNGMYVAVPHYDKSHLHIHICASGIEFRTGKSMRLTKTGLREMKVEFQKYQLQKYPQLTKSVVKHGKSKGKTMTDEEFQLKLRTGRESNRDEIFGILKNCYKNARSPQVFFDLIQNNGLEVYERGGRISGLIFKNKKFRLNKLGFTKERILELDREFSLRKLREKETEKTINR